MKRLLTLVLVILMACMTHPVFGGDLNPPGPPSAGSGMPTLLDIYNYLNSGTEPVIPGTFQEPKAGPGATMKTTKEIYDVIKGKLDQLNETKAEDVLGGKHYFDTSEGWGINDGSMEDRGGVTYTPDTADQAVLKGYHNGSGKVKGDADLVAGKIKKDVQIFEVTGTYPLAGVAKTGQTPTLPLDPAPEGSDGSLQKGVAWPNPRFTDNYDDTVTDNLTGLMWAKDANADGDKNWANALTYCNELSLGGHGDWRLPNVKELSSLIDWAYVDPALSNGAGTGHWSHEDAFTGVQSLDYWSSTTYATSTSYAWNVTLTNGNVLDGYETGTNYVWPVRGGQ